MKKLICALLCLALLAGLCPALAEEWTCPGCGNINDTAFCPYCGTAKPVGITCPQCGAVYDADSGYSFCPQCGASLSGGGPAPAENAPAPNVDDLLYGLTYIGMVPGMEDFEGRVEWGCGADDIRAIEGYESFTQEDGNLLSIEYNDRPFLGVAATRNYLFRDGRLLCIGYTLDDADPDFDGLKAQLSDMYGFPNETDETRIAFTRSLYRNTLGQDLSAEEAGAVFGPGARVACWDPDEGLRVMLANTGYQTTAVFFLVGDDGGEYPPAQTSAGAVRPAAVPEPEGGEGGLPEPAAPAEPEADGSAVRFGDARVPASVYMYPLYGNLRFGMGFQDVLGALGNPAHEELTDNMQSWKIEYIHITQQLQKGVSQEWYFGFLDDCLAIATCCSAAYDYGEPLPELDDVAAALDARYGTGARTAAPRLEALMTAIFGEEQPDSPIQIPEDIMQTWITEEGFEIMLSAYDDPWVMTRRILYYDPAIIDLLPEFESDGLRYRLNVRGELVVTGQADEWADTLALPEQLQGRQVAIIGNGAFCNGSLRQASLPSGLKTIGGGAFLSNPLEELTLPEGVERVGPSAFESCMDLESVRLPSSLNRICGKGFFYCPALKQIALPEGLMYLEDDCFGGASLDELTTPSTLRYIGKNAFMGAPLYRIRLTEGLRELGERPFEYCNFEALVLPASLEVIGDGLLFHCGELRQLEVAEGSRSFMLKDGSLYSADGKTLIWYDQSEYRESIEVPEGVEAIGGFAFEGCDAEHFTLPGTLKRIGKYAFCECNGLEEIEVPEGVEEVMDYAFAHCKYLWNVRLPMSLVNIGGNHVFAESPAVMITAPADSAAADYAARRGLSLILE